MSKCHGSIPRNVLVYAGIICSLIFAAATAQAQDAAAGLNPHTAVSDAGERFTAPEYAQQLPNSPAFEGSAMEGFASDAEAEFPQRTESAKEVWDLLSHTPANGKIGIETVIGPDTRVRINPTTSYPARAAGLITFNQGTGSFTCTGWLIGANTVATAGHCVHTGGPGGSWSTNVRFYPGRNAALSPYGSCSARRLYSVTGWTNSSNEEYDYGAIKLNCTVGNTVGWFGFFWTTASLLNLPTYINGYPGDKAFGTQWRAVDRVRATTTRQVFYQDDTFGGMSGSPVYYNRAGCGQCSMAIHAYGLHGLPPHSTNNHGTRIVQAVFNNLINWRNAP